MRGWDLKVRESTRSFCITKLENIFFSESSNLVEVDALDGVNDHVKKLGINVELLQDITLLYSE